MKLKTKLKLAGILALAALLLALYVCRQCGGATNREIHEAVRSESSAIQATVNARAAELGAKLDALDARFGALDAKLEANGAKLDALDAKLDRLLRLARPPLPDNLQRAE